MFFFLFLFVSVCVLSVSCNLVVYICIYREELEDDVFGLSSISSI